RPLHPPPTLSSWSTRPAGTCRHAWSYRPTSPSSRCHPNVPSSTRLRTCGSSCATTGFRTGSSNHTTISSTIVARPGTSSSISRGASCLSDCVNGRTSSDQWDSVYNVIVARKDFPAKDLKEFIGYAKANAEKLNVGHAGVGSITFTLPLLLNSLLG